MFTELQQVVLNFVINAEQAIARRATATAAHHHPHARRSRSACGSRSRTRGPGVPPENEAKLFQPFFTTKPVGEGTGLGLSVSYGIIHSLGGAIGYRRGAAGGAVFFFWVPVWRSEGS